VIYIHIYNVMLLASVQDLIAGTRSPNHGVYAQGHPNESLQKERSGTRISAKARQSNSWRHVFLCSQSALSLHLSWPLRSPNTAVCRLLNHDYHGFNIVSDQPQNQEQRSSDAGDRLRPESLTILFLEGSKGKSSTKARCFCLRCVRSAFVHGRT